MAMNIELKDLSHNPVYAQVREQIEKQFATRPSRQANRFPHPPRSHNNSPSIKARSSARTTSWSSWDL